MWRPGSTQRPGFVFSEPDTPVADIAPRVALVAGHNIATKRLHAVASPQFGMVSSTTVKTVPAKRRGFVS